METVYLCSVNELDINYENVFDFGSRAGQQSFFTSKAVLTVSNINMQDDGERQSVVIGKTLRELEAVDYLFFIDDSAKARYYFVKNKEFKTKGATRLILQLDQWSTYIFDFTLMESYIERCHVNRWGADNYPTREIEDEGLEFGENVASTNHNLFENKSPGMIVVTNIPIGKIADRKQATGGGGGPTPPTTRGNLTAKGYRFIKGFEGFGKEPYRVVGEVADTAGYGVREDFQKEFFELLKPFPCSEMLASSVLGTMIIKRFVEPVKNKLIADGFKIEDIKSNIFDVWVSHAMNAGVGGWSSGTPYKLFKEGQPDIAVAEAIKQWAITGEGGTVLPGLVERRLYESQIYLNADYTYRKIVTINRDGSYGPYVTDNGGNGFIPQEFGGGL